MKFTTKIFILAFILAPISIFSQNGSIEVEVIDSVQIKATSFEYILTLEDDYESYAVEEFEEDVKMNEIKVKNAQKMKLNNLETFLKNKKYKYTSLSESNLETNNKFNIFKVNDGFRVSLATFEELKKLSIEVKELDKVSGTIGKTTYQDKSQFEEELIKKLIEKAKIKAQTIAKYSNLTLGKIIEIKETKEVDNANFNFMDMIMKLDKKRNFNLASDVQNSNYTKAIVVKFKAD